MCKRLPKASRLFAICLILLGAAWTFLLADTSSSPLLPGSQPERVAIQWDGSILAITVYDASVITKLRRVVGRTSELTEMVRVVTRQSDPEGWETVLSAGYMPGSWQNEDGYFEDCYVVLSKNGDVWEGIVELFPTPSLISLYICTQGWYEDTMILGLALDDMGGSAYTSNRPASRTIEVTSAADTGTGTLRWALETARSGDVITFDPAVFPPDSPATIFVRTGLPPLRRGNVTIDASNAGVILDGSNIPRECPGGLEIISDGNAITGLQIARFPGAGIWIGSGSVGNTIGPNNVIAYNEGPGVGMSNPDSLRNTVTRNSIHDNRMAGIGLWNGSSAGLPSPLITDFDLLAGTVGGTACPDCTVEIFSDNVREGEPQPIHQNSEGEFYEGQTRADEVGFFSFGKHAPFTAPHLTATATDSEGHTSEFSVTTTGTNRTWILQRGSNLLKTQIQLLASESLDDNRMGDMYGLTLDAPNGILYGESPSDFSNRIGQVGLKWMNVSLDWFDWNAVGPAGPFSRHYVDPLQDQAIAGLVDLGVSVMCDLVFWDEGILTRLEEEGYSRFQTEGEIQRYLDFVRFVVSHFKGIVEYYEILNEPNVGGPGQYVAPLNYVNLVRRTVPIIRREDPEAKIVVGALPILDLERKLDTTARDYLFTIVTSDIMPLVDAVSWHPGPAFSALYYEDAYFRYPLFVLEVQDMAAANGFGGEYIIDGLGWRTARSFFSGEPWVFTETVAAKNLARGVVLHSGMNTAPGLADSLEGPKMPVARNLCTVMAGHEAIDMPAEIAIDYEPVAYCTFRYPNGDRMLAVWTDGIAQDVDPGIPATITFPGLTAETVTGIDVLHGFEQELVFETAGDNTIIRDLLVKDYPILIRLSDVTMGQDYQETSGYGFHRLGEF